MTWGGRARLTDFMPVGWRPGSEQRKLDWQRPAGGIRQATPTTGYKKNIGVFTQSFFSGALDAGAPAIADGNLPGREGAFTACAFWMADNLAAQGRLRQARDLFEGVLKHGGVRPAVNIARAEQPEKARRAGGAGSYGKG
jgi:hypothetical protein